MPSPAKRSPGRAAPLAAMFGAVVLATGAIGHLRADGASIQGAELEAFLRKADVQTVKAINRGVTRPRRVTLFLDGISRDAAWKVINQSRPGLTTLRHGERELDFEDTYRGECAAYELDKLLGLGMVPATVERVISGERGALILWIDGVITEGERREQSLNPPDAEEWSRQVFKMRLFDNLIYNTDRNLGNSLITADWRLRLIDHSRSFRKTESLRSPDQLVRFSRSLLEAMERLEEASLRERLGRYLSVWQIKALLERRDRLVALARQRAAERGELVYYP